MSKEIRPNVSDVWDLFWIAVILTELVGDVIDYDEYNNLFESLLDG